MSRVCSRCNPILSRYTDVLKGLVHQGTELRKRKHVNPNPKRANAIPYWDVKRQNEWLLSNVFDSMGNYLYCQACIIAAFGISKQRWIRQRNFKWLSSQQPVVDMTKEAVEEQRLGEFVIMPAGNETAFMTWWRSLSSSATVQVDTPMRDTGMLGKCPIQLRHQFSMTSSYLWTPTHNPMASQLIRQVPRTIFSQSSQHFKLPKLAPPTMKNVFANPLSESSIVFRGNAAEVLAAMVLVLIGWRNVDPRLQYAHTKKITATLAQNPRKPSEENRQQSIAGELLQQLTPVTSSVLRTKWRPSNNP